jgi:hypothetical protein
MEKKTTKKEQGEENLRLVRLRRILLLLAPVCLSSFFVCAAFARTQIYNATHAFRLPFFRHSIGGGAHTCALERCLHTLGVRVLLAADVIVRACESER